MADNSQQGPLSAEQLLEIWQGSVDTSYSEPYIQAGEGHGLEVHSQAFTQWARASLAVDRTFQSMYALPWSGQTNAPASGPAQATCAITFQRTRRLGDPLVLQAGLIWVDEQATDSSPTGPVLASTGRRYLLQNTVVFLPGEMGPMTGIVEAEKPGLNYDDPVPGSLNLLEQPGATRTNDLATVTISLAPLPPALQIPAQAVTLVGDDMPDMFTPDQIGQYMLFTSGMNEGKSGRVVGYVPPTAVAGSGVQLEQLVVVLLSATPGIHFDPTQPGPVIVKNGSTIEASAKLLVARAGPGGYCLAFALTSGSATIPPGWTCTQIVSAGTATGTISVVYANGLFTAEAPSGSPLSGGAGWRMAQWALDWGLSATNSLSPSGGELGMLDALGQEKRLPRLSGEVDDDYRLRITRVADVVTPNAVKRALVRSTGSTTWCLREVGGTLLPGFFFDRHDQGGDAWDDGALLFTGAYTSGSFQPGELCEYRRGLDVLAWGYWGAISTPTTVTNPAGYAPASYQAPALSAAAGADFTLVLSQGRFAVPAPTVAWQSGDRIVGTLSGAVFTPSASVANPHIDALRWHCLLSYTEFRAFFVAQVPSVGYGEFGFAWDMTAPFDAIVGAWDAGPTWLNFYDGFPAGNASYYQRIFNDVSNVVAGGVGFEIEQSNGTTCA
jgi:hypothetical protein